jgi:hypothetical protein
LALAGTLVLGIGAAEAAVAQTPTSANAVESRLEEQRRPQVAAATSAAIDSLYADVLRASITPDLSVSQFLARTTGGETNPILLDELQRADQIGGPRWIDDQTCQVKLEIAGSRVADALVRIAESRPDRAPLSADVLRRRLGDWRERTFIATGSSIGAGRASTIRPTSGAWRNVSDESRTQAVNAARENAVQQILAQAAPITLPGEPTTAGEVLTQRESVRQSMIEWLRSRPVTPMQFTDDLQVRLELAAPADEVFDAFVSAARNAAVTLPEEAAQFEALRREFRRRITSTSGTAKVRPADRGPERIQAIAALPAQPPNWVFQQIDGEATAPFGESRTKLMARQDAEERAADVVRTRLLSMPLAPGVSVADAAKRDPAVREAVEQAMARTSVYRVIYDPDAGVTVKMMLDPRAFWGELQRP